MIQEKEKANSNKFKSRVKRKSKYTHHSPRDKVKTTKKIMLDHLNDDEKETLRQDDNKSKKEKRLTLIVIKRNNSKNIRKKEEVHAW